MTGMVYRHEPMGALPVGHYSLMNLESLNVKEEMSYNYDTMLHIYPTAGMDYSVLSDTERVILDKVIKKFKNYKAKEIVDYMHEEKAYNETNAGEIIPFSLAKKRRSFGGKKKKSLVWAKKRRSQSQSTVDRQVMLIKMGVASIF